VPADAERLAGAKVSARVKMRDPRLWVVVAGALLCAAVVVLVPITLVRALFVVPLCLILPGYAITAAVFAKRHLEYQQRLMLTLGLSFVALVLGSLLLDVVPGGLQKGSWLILLVIVIVVASVVGTLRGLPLERRRSRRWSFRVTRVDALLLLVGAIGAGSAFAITRHPRTAPNAVGYSALWMLPSGSAHAPSVNIGVISNEQHPTRYRLLLRMGRTDRIVDSSLMLRPGQQTKFVVPLSVSRSTSSGMVTATLYKDGTSGVYRQVTADLPARSVTR
jgi:hypothetical protein